MRSDESVKKKSRILKELCDWALVFAIAAATAWFVTHYVFVTVEIPTGSMEYTIPKPSRVICTYYSYWFSSPQRGDIVMLEPPDGDEYCYIKRIIGMPGETITIRDGLVYINDSVTPLAEPYLKEPPHQEDFGPYLVPEDHYFVMGDNRNRSNDSRYWVNKYVPEDDIYAKAQFVFWPTFSWLG